MPLNWLCSLFMVLFLLIVCCYLYCLKKNVNLYEICDKEKKSEFYWLW